MQQLRKLFAYVFGEPAPEPAAEDSLDCERVVHLDAEDLAEQGIGAAYADLRPQLQRYTNSPLEIREEIDEHIGSYAVSAGTHRFQIWGPGLDSNDGWARATVAFFAIVNASLDQSPYKFYALYGGNDLSGVFLTEEQFSLARKSMARQSDWPYLPLLPSNERASPGKPGAPFHAKP